MPALGGMGVMDKACAVIFVDYLDIFSTNIGEISQDNLQISSPQT